MNEINTSRPAFPSLGKITTGGFEPYTQSTGLSIIDYFAAKAMQGLLARDGIYSESESHSGVPNNEKRGWFYKELAEASYEIATAMHEELNEYKQRNR